ncbi:MAG: hypothetical protein J5505_03715 [Spirochaetaceae bacterium]|nr:hypothetical protein [Spirochaetaceae bacterium]
MTDNIFSNANSFVLWLILFFGLSFLFTRHNKKRGKTAEYDERQQQIRLLSLRISYFILIAWSLIGMLLAENKLLFCDVATMFFLGILLSATAFICITTWKNASDPVLNGETAEQKSKKLTLTIVTGIFWVLCVIWIIADYIKNFEKLFTDGKLNGNSRLLFIVVSGLIMLINVLIKQIYCKKFAQKDEED